MEIEKKNIKERELLDNDVNKGESGIGNLGRQIRELFPRQRRNKKMNKHLKITNIEISDHCNLWRNGEIM